MTNQIKTNVSLIDTYLGEQTIAGNGASQAVSLPAETNFVLAYAEDGAAYLSVNGVASVNSGTYVPEDNMRLIGPFSNFSSLAFFATSPAKIHLIYMRE